MRTRGLPLPENDPRAASLQLEGKWSIPTVFPDHLEVNCPHCGSPEIEDEYGNSVGTDIEDRLSTFDSMESTSGCGRETPN